MHTILIVVQVMVCASLIVLILIQHGKGADMGAAFGSGASATVFGSRGSASFLTRTTAGLAAAFFILSLTLAYFSTGQREPRSVLESVTIQTQPASDVPTVNVEVPSIPAAPSTTDNGLPAIQEETSPEAGKLESVEAATSTTETEAAPSTPVEVVTPETTPAVNETEEKTQ